MINTAKSSPGAIRRIRQPESFRAQIYADLRARLQRAEFGPDDRLVDTEVAEFYGTSRMPVREALLALTSQGFLCQTTRGFVLPRLTPEDIRDIFAVRKMLEPSAAAIAAVQIDARELRAVLSARDLARATHAADDAEGLMLANIEFRAAWLASVNNRRLTEVIESFRDHAQTVRIVTLRRAQTRNVVMRGIEALAGAFERHDAEAVRARMLEFMEAAEREFFDAVSEQSNTPASVEHRG